MLTDAAKTAIVVGGGVAGMSAACALAEAGLRVKLVERRNYLGGRASSYRHPGVDEVIDNCQHVLFGCCTNLIGFYRRIGVRERIHWTSTMTMIEPGGRRSLLGPSRLGPLGLPAPLHALPRLLMANAFTRQDKLALAHAFRKLMQPVAAESAETLGTWLRRNGQTQGAIDRFWRLVIASALNADVDVIALPYAAKVIRELFLNSAEAGSMGMSTVPLSELYAGAEQYLHGRGGEVVFNASVEGAEWDEETSQWTLTTRMGELVADFLVLALPFEAMAKLLPQMPPADGVEKLAGQIARHEHGPICSVHLWFDREITELDHAVLARSRDSLDVQQEPAAAGAQDEGQLSGAGRERVARVCGAEPGGGDRAGGARAGGVLSCCQRSEGGKGRAGEGSARDVHCAAGNRCGAARLCIAVAELRAGRRLDCRPGGRRRWRARREAGTWRRRRCARRSASGGSFWIRT